MKRKIFNVGDLVVHPSANIYRVGVVKERHLNQKKPLLVQWAHKPGIYTSYIFNTVHTHKELEEFTPPKMETWM